MPITTIHLTRREREVVTLICEEGPSNKEVAWRDGITYLSTKLKPILAMLIRS
jgi:hypothetical protein